MGHKFWIFSWSDFRSCLSLCLPGPGLLCHPTQAAGPHRLCRKRSTLFHLLESLWVSHLRRNLLVFLGSIFLWVSNMYIPCNENPLWIFSHSNTATSIHFLHCSLLDNSACTYYIILNWQFEQFPVRFCFQIVKAFHVVDRPRSSW